MAKGVVLTPEQQQERRREIKNTALELFYEKGFRQTSMREISEVLGMGKSSLYDFFTSKYGIVVFAYEEITEAAAREAKKIVDSQSSPEQCLRMIMKNNLTYNKENKHLIAWLNTEESYLDEEYRQRISEARHSYQDIVQSVIKTGIDTGIFRKGDTMLAARLLINTMLSIAYTSRPSGSLEDMLEEAMSIFFYGIQNDNMLN